jgi:hypothetical protein
VTLKGFCAGLSLLGLLSSDAIASEFTTGDKELDIKTEEPIELFVACEASSPLLSLKWDGDDGDNSKAAETASIFLSAPSVTPQLIIDKAKECFSTLKDERGMTIVYFDNMQLRCGIGPDINWGRIVIGHAH